MLIDSSACYHMWKMLRLFVLQYIKGSTDISVFIMKTFAIWKVPSVIRLWVVYITMIRHTCNSKYGKSGSSMVNIRNLISSFPWYKYWLLLRLHFHFSCCSSLALHSVLVTTCENYVNFFITSMISQTLRNSQVVKITQIKFYTYLSSLPSHRAAKNFITRTV